MLDNNVLEFRLTNRAYLSTLYSNFFGLSDQITILISCIVYIECKAMPLIFD